jgi:hypothetical protein
MNQLFSTQEASFDRTRIQLFDESTAIQEEFKEI